MRKLASLFLSLLLVCLTGCSFFPIWNSEEPPAPVPLFESAEVTSVIQEFTVELQHDNRLYLQHANTYYDQGISTIQLQFISQDLVEMCEARELIVDITENFLGKLNQDPLLAPQFANFPFMPYNLEIYIVYESFFGKYVDPKYIEWICLEDGTVTYYTFDLRDNTKNCWHARHEAYVTSREIVVYEREAERRYEEAHKSTLDIFGPMRYIPTTK